MQQGAQKPRQKFCARKTAKMEKTPPKSSEKGETGCVLGAGEDGNGWKQVRTDGKTRSPNQNEPHSHATHAKRKPAETQSFRRFCGRGRRTCLGCRLGCCSPVGSAQHRPRREPRPARQSATCARSPHDTHRRRARSGRKCAKQAESEGNSGVRQKR